MAAADHLVLSGMVVRGDGRGRELGFPTANIALEAAGEGTGTGTGTDPHPRVDAERALADGIYEGWLEDEPGTRRAAAISIGGRPTYYGESGARLVEAFVLDFDGDLYGQHVRVGVGRRVRGQVRFSSSEELVTQMRRDVEAVRAAASGA